MPRNEARAAGVFVALACLQPVQGAQFHHSASASTAALLHGRHTGRRTGVHQHALLKESSQLHELGSQVNDPAGPSNASSSGIIAAPRNNNTRRPLPVREPVTDSSNASHPGYLDDYWDPSHWEAKNDRLRARMGKVGQKRECELGILAHGNMDPEERCPTSCPFLVQNKEDDEWCSFRCVAKEQCTAFNPKTPIGDTELGICRAPMVYACKEPMTNGEDSCKVCNDYYILLFGQCWWEYNWLVSIAVIALIAVAVFLLLWVIDMIVRPVTNHAALQEAHVFRSRMKLHMPVTSASARFVAWPMLTNMHKTIVAGPGWILHMNFQAMVIVWAFLIALLYTALGLIINTDMFNLGTRAFGTPIQNCFLVQWGYHVQQELMWAKLLFLWMVYVLSVGLVLTYSIVQLRQYQEITWENKTIGDFVAELVDLPSIRGTQKAEVELKRELEVGTGKPVVGISLAWMHHEEEENVDYLIEEWLQDAQAKYNTLEGDDSLVEQASEEVDTPCSPRTRLAEEQAANSRSYNPLTMHRSKLIELESWALAPGPDPDHLRTEEQIQGLLGGLIAQRGFVVFETEEDRDEVVERFKEGGLNVNIGGTTANCRLKHAQAEPDSVIWENFGHKTRWIIAWRAMRALFYVFLALATWTVVFYAPYAFAMFNFNYDNGNEPGVAFGLAFTVVVVAGNAMMYEVCARIADSSGFHFLDGRETCYFLLYLTACLLNVALDLCVTYFMARQIMVGLGFRTVDGKPLENVNSFVELFESFAMQRIMAKNIYEYSFPSTFLIPFLIEPLAVIIGPLFVGTWIVGSHPEIVGKDAEDWLQAPRMDLGRYADIMLNMVLGILYFYFPGGNTHKLFLAMMFSHIWIYAFDYCRVLRAMKRFYISSMTVDWWVQVVLAIGCGLILSCIVFKANCQGYGFCFQGAHLFAAWSGVGLLHCTVHLFIFTYFVPRWGIKDEEQKTPRATGNYAETNGRLPCSYFNTNKVHCLRSKFFYKHEVPCMYAQIGREHLLTINEELGCYFHCQPQSAEIFSIMKVWKDAKESLRQEVVDLTPVSFKEKHPSWYGEPGETGSPDSAEDGAGGSTSKPKSKESTPTKDAKDKEEEGKQ